MEETVQQLRSAVQTGRTDVIRLALDAHTPKVNKAKGPSGTMDATLMEALNTVTPDHGTMLHLAAKLGNADVVRALLVSGVDPSIKDNAGNTSYDLAKSSSQVTMVFHDVLLQSIAQSKTDQVQQLLNSGIDINFNDESTGGNTALHWAATYSTVDIVQLLFDFSPDVNVTNSDGSTPLHDAVLRGEADIVQELVKRGANVDAVATKGNSEGLSPLDLAADKPELMKVLSSPVVLTNGHAENGEAEQSDETNKDGNEAVEKSLTDDDAEQETATQDKDVSATAEDLPASPSEVASEHDASQQVSSLLQETEEEDVDDEEEEEEEEEDVEQEPRLAFLWPHPQQLIQKNGDRFRLKQDFTVQLVAVPQSGNLEPMVDLWTIQSALLMEKGYRCVLENAAVCVDPGSQVICTVNPLAFGKSESYRISVRENQVSIVASDLPGLWHATCTFVQLVQLCDKEGIPQLEVSDWPSIRRRAVLLDLSAGRVPRMDTLLQLVNSFAQLKYNEIHLYVKAYKDCPIQDTMPYTGSELLDLEVFCQWRFITLVPHIDILEASDLSPALFSIFQQVLSRFGTARVVNIGPNLTRKLLDSSPLPPNAEPEKEADKNGPNANKAKSDAEDAVKSATSASEAAADSETKGESTITGDNHTEPARPAPFILSIQDQLRLIGIGRNQTPLFCANVISTQEAGFTQLPVGSVAMLYGSKSNSDFRKAGHRLSANGQGFYVCPGTGVWNSIGGCPEGSISTISNAVKTAITNPNAMGILLTNWAGSTYSNHPVLSWPAFIVAAGMAWKASTDLDFLNGNLPALVNRHMLQNPESPLGDVILEVGHIGTFLTRASVNQLDVPINSNAVSLPAKEGSFLCRLIQNADGVDLEHITPEVINSAMRRLRKSQASLSAAEKIKLDRRVYIQVHLTMDLMLWACKMARALLAAGRKPSAEETGLSVINVGLTNLPATSKTDIANKLLSMMEDYRRVWFDQSFQSGLEESGLFFKGLLQHLVPDTKEE